MKILEKAEETVVTFLNFTDYRNWFHMLFKGCMPVGSELPFEWYDTPNTHFLTLKDFCALCAKEGIGILETRAESDNLIGRILIALGLPNLGASCIIARLARKS